MDTGTDSTQSVVFNSTDISIAENDNRQLTHSERLLKQLERPLDTITQAVDLNNGAVKLFVEGHVTTDQLMRFSLGLARRADELAEKIFNTDMSTKKMPERKQMVYTAIQPIALENRKRAIDLKLAQEQKDKPQTPRDIVKPR